MAEHKKKYHVHVYKVEGLLVLNVEAVDEKSAKALALELAKMDKYDKQFDKPDCRLLAVDHK